MRKLILFVLMAIGIVSGPAVYSQNDTLLAGKWNLFKIIDNMTGNEITPVTPREDFKFWISFEGETVRYNREINKCKNTYKIIGPHMIKFLYYDECTEICCDKEFSQILTYEECTGFFIKDPNTLVLVSEDRIFYFSRTME
jgi:hypothetical protein